MAQDYRKDAENILKTIRKYEARLDTAKRINLEKLNSTIASFRYIYYDLINTAKLLEERGGKIDTKYKDDDKENENAA